VLDRLAAAPRTLPEVTQHAIRGGVDAVLCRIKDAPAAEVRRLAQPVREICRRAGTPFVMSHFANLALELDADGVQLGLGDPPAAQVIDLVGTRMAVGYSTHGVGEARNCFAEGVDYVFLGPIFATPEKLKYGPPLGVDAVSQSAGLPGPVVLIGGINADNCEQVVQAGGKRVAAISALQRTSDLAAQARRMKAILSARDDPR
jgi:thiamine-phosphate pyrophosphorylase